MRLMTLLFIASSFIVSAQTVTKTSRNTPMQKESGNETPLIIAIGQGEIENVKILIEQGAPLNPDSLNGYTSPLARAVERKQTEIVQLLLNKGANINAKYSEDGEDCINCPYGITVMHTVVDMMSVESNDTNTRLFDLLITYRPDLSIESENGYTALEHACFEHNTKLVDLLIKNGAKLRPSTLHCAAMFSNHIMVKHLLKLGADPNAKNPEGNTPLIGLYNCCGDGFGEGITMDDRIKTVNLLLAYRADPKIKNAEGESFIDICNKGNKPELKNLMIKRGY